MSVVRVVSACLWFASCSVLDAASLPIVDPGLFVISGVMTCGGGEGYCLLGMDCTLDADFLPDPTGHCEGLKNAFTPSAFFSCCKVSDMRSSPTRPPSHGIAPPPPLPPFEKPPIFQPTPIPANNVSFMQIENTHATIPMAAVEVTTTTDEAMVTSDAPPPPFESTEEEVREETVATREGGDVTETAPPDVKNVETSTSQSTLQLESSYPPLKDNSIDGGADDRPEAIGSRKTGSTVKEIENGGGESTTSRVTISMVEHDPAMTPRMDVFEAMADMYDTSPEDQVMEEQEEEEVNQVVEEQEEQMDEPENEPEEQEEDQSQEVDDPAIVQEYQPYPVERPVVYRQEPMNKTKEDHKHQPDVMKMKPSMTEVLHSEMNKIQPQMTKTPTDSHKTRAESPKKDLPETEDLIDEYSDVNEYEIADSIIPPNSLMAPQNPMLFPSMPVMPSQNPILNPQNPMLFPSMPVMPPQNPLLPPQNPIMPPLNPIASPKLPVMPPQIPSSKPTATIQTSAKPFILDSDFSTSPIPVIEASTAGEDLAVSKTYLNYIRDKINNTIAEISTNLNNRFPGLRPSIISNTISNVVKDTASTATPQRPQRPTSQQRPSQQRPQRPTQRPPPSTSNDDYSDYGEANFPSSLNNRDNASAGAFARPRDCDMVRDVEWRFMEDGETMCYGVLIDAIRILTSASCVLKLFESNMASVSAVSNRGNNHSIGGVTVHENFQAVNNPQSINKNDLGIVTLKATVPYGDQCIPKLPFKGQILRNMKCSSTHDDELESKSVPTMNRYSSNYNYLKTDSPYCSHYLSTFEVNRTPYLTLACQGAIAADTRKFSQETVGSGVICNGILAGIELSTGLGAKAYTPLSMYVDWINRNIKGPSISQRFRVGYYNFKK